MYWIYLVIFVLTVFVPDLVTSGFWVVNEKATEELAIFLLCGTAFVIYLIKENRLEKNRSEKAAIQRDASRMSKDLTSSYSYIGEINRKLEIFKNISLGMPIWSKIPKMKEREAFEYIMAAVKIITRADEYTLRFVEKDSLQIMLEIRSKRAVKIDLPVKTCLDEGKKYFETKEYMVIISPEELKGVVSILSIRKKNFTNSADDPDILKAICSQSLFLFMFSRKDHHKK